MTASPRLATVRRARWQIVRVEGDSMAPTLWPGEVLLCGRYRKRARPATGELVIALREGFPSLIVKRVLTSPGETLPEEVCATPSEVPKGRYFLVGDNPAAPLARRVVGPVEERAICAKVLCVIWPWRRWRRPR